MKAGPQTTTELTKQIMATKGLDPTNKVLAGSVGFSVLRSLRGLAKRRTVTQTRKRGRCTWALA